MNVFYLDDDPVTAAAWLCDQHVSKMILESAQMMCTAIRMHMGLEDTPREELPEELKFLYKKAHPKHGSTIWVGECFRNFQWLFSHVVQMHSHHKHRFGTRDPVGSYRKFYVADKAKFATWTNSEPPHWWPKEKC
jgi:hypothetical protein